MDGALVVAAVSLVALAVVICVVSLFEMLYSLLRGED